MLFGFMAWDCGLLRAQGEAGQEISNKEEVSKLMLILKQKLYVHWQRPSPFQKKAFRFCLGLQRPKGVVKFCSGILVGDGQVPAHTGKHMQGACPAQTPCWMLGILPSQGPWQVLPPPPPPRADVINSNHNHLQFQKDTKASYFLSIDHFMDKNNISVSLGIIGKWKSTEFQAKKTCFRVLCLH